MRQGQRDYLGIFLWAITWAAAILAAGAFGDQGHDAPRALAFAAAVVALGAGGALAVRAARRHRMPALAVAAAWRATWMATRALKAARQNEQRIDKCESRTRRITAAIEADVAEACGADADTLPRGLPRERWLAAVPVCEDEAAV